MTTKRIALPLLLFGVSAAFLGFRAGAAADKPVGRPTRGAAQAAERAFGRRVLVIDLPRGKPHSAAIYESHKAPEGWALYDGAPPGAGPLRDALASLAAAAKESYDLERRRATPEVERALDLFAVKTVLIQGITDQPLVVDRTEAEPVLRIAGSVPADGEPAAGDPVALAASLRAADTLHRDWDDDLWGGGIVVEADTAGRFVFPYAAEGAVVTVGGAPVAAPGRAGPLLVLDLPAGRSRVEVSRRDAEWTDLLPIAAMAGLMGGLLWFLLSVRPQVPPEDPAPSDAPAPRP